MWDHTSGKSMAELVISISRIPPDTRASILVECSREDLFYLPLPVRMIMKAGDAFKGRAASDRSMAASMLKNSASTDELWSGLCAHLATGHDKDDGELSLVNSLRNVVPMIYLSGVRQEPADTLVALLARIARSERDDDALHDLEAIAPDVVSTLRSMGWDGLYKLAAPEFTAAIEAALHARAPAVSAPRM